MKMEHEELTERIIGCAMQVHSTLGPGFLESVYEKALAHALVVGEFSADMFVEETVMVENKAVQTLHPVNEVQLVN